MGDMIVLTTLLENIDDPCIKKTVIFKNMFHSVLYACQRVEFWSITLHINQPVRRPQQNKLVEFQVLLGISTCKFWLATSLMLVDTETQLCCLLWHFCSSHPHFSSSNPMFFSCIPYFTQFLCLNLPFSILNPSYTMFFRTWQNHPVVCKLHSPFPFETWFPLFPMCFHFFPIKHGFPTKSQCSIMFPWFVFPMFLP